MRRRRLSKKALQRKTRRERRIAENYQEPELAREMKNYEKALLFHAKRGDAKAIERLAKAPFFIKLISVDSLMKDKVTSRRKNPIVSEGGYTYETYEEYINSSEWRAKKAVVIATVGGLCQVCNAAPKGKLFLEAHHRTYARIGREKEYDLTVLCTKCHKAFHRRGHLVYVKEDSELATP